MLNHLLRLSAIAVLILVLTACTGGGNSNSADGGSSQATNAGSGQEATENFYTEGYPIVDDPITLTMMGAKAPTQSAWHELFWFQHMEQLTNIRFDFKTVDAAGYQEKKNLAFATQDLPDVFYGANLTPVDEVKYGEEGMLLPLNDLIDNYAPNFKKLLEEDPLLRPTITSADGNIYTLPSINYLSRDMEEEFWINQEWLDEIGHAMPTTLDELYTVLKGFKDKHPDSYPAAGLSAEGADFKLIILTALGYLDRKYTVIDNEVVYVPAEEKYQEYLRFMNRLWTEQLLDPEYFTQTSAQLQAKGQAMQLGMFTTAAPFLVVGQENNDRYAIVPPLTSQWNDKQIWPRHSGITTGTFAITSVNPYPEATMRWVDYVYSDEGADMVITGPEGLLWEYTDASKEVWAYSQELATAAGYETSNAYKSAKVSPHAGTIIPSTINLDFYYKSGKSTLDLAVEENLMPHWQDAFPKLSYTAEESDRLSVLGAEIDSYVLQMEAKFITGEQSLDQWESYVKSLDSMGLSEMTAINQTAYARWSEARAN